MLSILFNSSFWYAVLLTIAVVLVIVACIKFPNARVYVASIFMILLVGSSIYCSIQLNYYYSSEGGIYGYITGSNKNNKAVLVDGFKYQLDNLVLVKEAKETYSATVSLDGEIEFDANKEYTLYVNDVQTLDGVFTETYAATDYTYSFYDKEMNLLCKDTLYFRIWFYDYYTTLEIYTNGGQTAVNYWNKYLSRNMLVIEVKELSV